MPFQVTAFPILNPPTILPSPSTNTDRTHEDTPSLRPNYDLRPKCKVEERIFQWKGIHVPPLSTIKDPVILFLSDLASQASLRDAKAPGTAVKKFHTFCDAFSIPETRRLPASFEVLHSFALWVVTDPSSLDMSLIVNTHFEPVSITTARKYLAGICAWHIAQGWPEPLSVENHKRIDWSLRGLQNLFGKHSHPIRPPITVPML